MTTRLNENRPLNPKLVKKAPMQGPRSPEERGVHETYVELRETRETPQVGLFHQL